MGAAAAEQVKVGKARALGGKEESMQPIEWLPDEILCIVFSNLDAKTLMATIPQVSKLWRD